MTPFIHDDFLLETDTARKLFHESAEDLPIIDFHNHLCTEDIFMNRSFSDITEAGLAHDHYKWRAMRANGISERLITGDAGVREKFDAWTDTVQNCIGNPLYHWTHLELKRYFGIDEILSPSTAERIWNHCNNLLQSRAFTIQGLLRMQKVEVLCTTDDPVDDLEWHRKLKESNPGFQVLPTFRPDNVLNIEHTDYREYIGRLGTAAEMKIRSFDDLLEALERRLTYFVENGCRITDHSLESPSFIPATKEQAAAVFSRIMSGAVPVSKEAAAYRGFLLIHLGKEYAKRDLAMQLHIGALRNNSTRLFRSLGRDIGCDSIADFNFAKNLSGILNAMDLSGSLPRIVFYYLNPRDAYVLSAMAGNYQGNESSIRGKIQLGSAWWFCDHRRGIEYQLDTLAETGMLSAFIGMLTDSRSFLSFPRHEYFRRILCNKIGKWVEDGEYPKDMTYLKKLVRDICYSNARNYFQI